MKSFKALRIFSNFMLIVSVLLLVLLTVYRIPVHAIDLIAFSIMLKLALDILDLKADIIRLTNEQNKEKSE